MSYERLFALAQEIRRQGHDTVVILPFDTEDAYRRARAQMELIGRELLIFTKKLTEIRLQIGEVIRTWSVERAEGMAEIRLDGGTPQLWTIYCERASIPQHMLTGDEANDEFEVKLAIAHDEQYVYQPLLYSYFPTSVRFPFPVLAHATIDLSNNRQNVLESELNRFVLNRLAILMAIAAERIGKEAMGKDPWRPLSMITPQSRIDPVVEKLQFLDALKRAARERAIIPVFSGALVRAADALHLDGEKTDWLPVEGFADLVPTPPAPVLGEGLRLLAVPLLAEDVLCARLDQLSRTGKLSLALRTRVVARFCRPRARQPTALPALLIDDSNQVIDAGAQVFLPPEDAKFELPPWVSLRILNTDLTRQLQEQLGISSGRELVAKLATFRVREYSLIPILQGILAAGSTYVAAEAKQEAARSAEVLRAIFVLYAATENPPKWQSDSVRVVTRVGSIVPIRQLYLGREYADGKLSEALYGEASPLRLVAGPDVLGLADADPEKLAKFFGWLGAETRPREVSVIAPGEFRDYFLSRLADPLLFDDGEFYKRSALKDAEVRVQSIDGLDEILTKASPYAILTWLASDVRLEQWRSNGDPSATLLFKPPRKQQPRELRSKPQDLDSYVTWRIATTAWMPISETERVPPRRCLATPLTSSPEIHRLLPPPQIQPSHPLLHSMGIDATRLRHAIERAGVHISIESIPWEDCYRLLLDLPERDPSGSSARALYRALATRELDGEPLHGEVGAEFLRRGRLLGNHGGKSEYISIQDLYYDDGGVLPSNVARELPLLALERRRGAMKIRRIFGVVPLDAKEVGIQIIDREPSPHAVDLEREFHELKPFLYVLRMSEAASARGLPDLAKLTVSLHLSASGVATLDERRFEIKLSTPGDFVINGSEILVVDAQTEPSGLLRDELLADLIGEAVARVLGLDRKPDFARVASCSPERRCALVARILDCTFDEVRSRLDHAAKQIGITTTAPAVGGAAPWVSPVPRPAPASTANKAEAGAASPAEPLPPTTAVQVEPQTHVPLPLRERVRFRVSPEPADAPGSGAQRKLVDWRECEKVAFFFEEEQGRFPLRVGHLQGFASYGCDILSFASETDRAHFQAGPSRERIVRFIEVKGRSRDDGAVQLTSNELISAQTEAARYFIYRLYESTLQEWKLLTLQNPLQNPTKRIHEVNLRRASQTEAWLVTEVTDDSQRPS